MARHKGVDDIVDKVYIMLDKKYSKNTLLHCIRHIFWCTKFCIKNPFLPRISLPELLNFELKEDYLRGKLKKIKTFDDTKPSVIKYYEGLIGKINEFIYRITTN
jgi:hypothetical protein